MIARSVSIADVVERAVGEELTPAIPRIEKLEEEHELTLASHRSLTLPLGIESTSRRVQRPAVNGPRWGDCCLTY